MLFDKSGPLDWSQYVDRLDELAHLDEEQVTHGLVVRMTVGTGRESVTVENLWFWDVIMGLLYLLEQAFLDQGALKERTLDAALQARPQLLFDDEDNAFGEVLYAHLFSGGVVFVRSPVDHVHVYSFEEAVSATHEVLAGYRAFIDRVAPGLNSNYAHIEYMDEAWRRSEILMRIASTSC